MYNHHSFTCTLNNMWQYLYIGPTNTCTLTVAISLVCTQIPATLHTYDDSGFSFQV